MLNRGLCYWLSLVPGVGLFAIPMCDSAFGLKECRDLVPIVLLNQTFSLLLFVLFGGNILEFGL